jgi:hypothetical protein
VRYKLDSNFVFKQKTEMWSINIQSCQHVIAEGEYRLTWSSTDERERELFHLFL